MTVEDMQAAYVRPSRKPGRPAVEGGRQSVTLRLRGPLLAWARAEADRRGWALAHVLDLLISRAVLASDQSTRTEEMTAVAFEIYDAHMHATRAPTLRANPESLRQAPVEIDPASVTDVP